MFLSNRISKYNKIVYDRKELSISIFFEDIQIYNRLYIYIFVIINMIHLYIENWNYLFIYYSING